MCPAEASAKAKVGQLNVSVSVYEDVIWLDVAMDEAHFVNALHSTGELCDVELSQLFFEDAQADEKAHHVPSRDVLHNKVQVVLVLERIVETHHPLIVGLGQDVPLSLNVGYLVPQQHILLTECLHGVQSSSVLFSGQAHLTKGSDAESLDSFEHGFIHLRTLKPDIVRLLLTEHHTHLLLGL